MSSPLPDPMRRQAEPKGYRVGIGARGYAFNADMVTMIDFLDIGTRADSGPRRKSSSPVLADAKDRSGRQTL